MIERSLDKYDFQDSKGYGAVTPQGIFRPVNFDDEGLSYEGNHLEEDRREKQLSDTEAWKLYLSQISFKNVARGRPKGSKNRKDRV